MLCSIYFNSFSGKKNIVNTIYHCHYNKEGFLFALLPLSSCHSVNVHSEQKNVNKHLSYFCQEVAMTVVLSDYDNEKVTGQNRFLRDFFNKNSALTFINDIH